MSDLRRSISHLGESLARTFWDVRVGAGDENDIARAQAVLPLTGLLVEWYRVAAPLEFEIPWAAEGLVLSSPSELLETQIGYRWSDEIGGELDDEWNPAWVVIGDCSADPLIADTEKPTTPILISVHGTGTWQALPIAPGLCEFLMLLSHWIESYAEFHGRLWGANEEISSEFFDSLRKRLSTTLSEACIDNLLSYFEAC